jgi:hypothetical protein
MPIPYSLIAKFVFVGALVLAITIQTLRLHAAKAENATLVAQNKAFIADVATKTAQVQLADQQHADDIKAAQDTVSKDLANGLQDKLSDANTRLAAYSKRLYTALNEGCSRTPGMSTPPDAARQASAAAQIAELDANLTICTENTVVAQGWQDWYKKVSVIPR